MIPFLKVKGIRQRWLLNSISILVMILVVVVAAFSPVSYTHLTLPTICSV